MFVHLSLNPTVILIKKCQQHNRRNRNNAKLNGSENEVLIVELNFDTLPGVKIESEDHRGKQRRPRERGGGL